MRFIFILIRHLYFMKQEMESTVINRNATPLFNTVFTLCVFETCTNLAKQCSFGVVGYSCWAKTGRKREKFCTCILLGRKVVGRYLIQYCVFNNLITSVDFRATSSSYHEIHRPFKATVLGFKPINTMGVRMKSRCLCNLISIPYLKTL